ncbi:VanZ family protein [Camelliibacillus cellulosilyticus]|uniref:VanZ family protein n=1 Tax=Camelliibacillus cellulosilyticus TaxID=2174486 RepID=A0ABV9GMV3_9BACL
MEAVVRKRVKQFCATLFFAYFLTLIYLTLFTYNYYVYGKSFNLIFFDSIKLMLASGDLWLIVRNIFGNVLLFLPFGFFVPIILRSARSFFICLFLSFIVSLFIESCQYEFAERIFDVDDILLNTLGGVLGWMVFKPFHGLYQMLNRKK